MLLRLTTGRHHRSLSSGSHHRPWVTLSAVSRKALTLMHRPELRPLLTLTSLTLTSLCRPELLSLLTQLSLNRIHRPRWPVPRVKLSIRPRTLCQSRKTRQHLPSL